MRSVVHKIRLQDFKHNHITRGDAEGSIWHIRLIDEHKGGGGALDDPLLAEHRPRERCSLNSHTGNRCNPRVPETVQLRPKRRQPFLRKKPVQ